MIVTIFISIQLAIGAYLYSTVVDGLGRHSWVAAGTMAFCVACLAAALLMERTRWFRHSIIASKIGYGWMGVSFIFLSIAATLDTLQWLLPAFSDRSALQWLLGIGSTASLYGRYSASRINVKQTRLTSSKLETPLRIAQISDLHLGDSSSLRTVSRIVDAIHQLDVDIIVSTGDLFDGYLPLMEPFVKQLRRLPNPPLGRFAVSGNHECYAGLEACLELTRRAGFSVLRNESETLRSDVAIIGMDDPLARNDLDRQAVDALAFDGVDPRRYRLFLNHRPSVRPERFSKFDLQLSGHTHGGQIFPFHILSKLSYSARPGLTELDSGSHLYLSRGTGSWGPQFRVFAPPEISYITIEPEPRDKPNARDANADA